MSILESDGCIPSRCITEPVHRPSIFSLKIVECTHGNKNTGGFIYCKRKGLEMEKAFSTPKNEMKNSCGEAVYHNAYLYFSLICHFCENRYRRRGEGRGGGGVRAMDDWFTAWTWPVITTSFRPKRSKNLYPFSVATVVYWVANLRHTLCFFKIRLSSRWWILFKFCSEIRHCRSNERSFWSFRRFDGFHAVTVTIAEVHKKTYGKPKVIKSIVKTEQDNKTVSYKIFSKCRIRISLNGGC